jgi:CRISPR-associated protein Csm3
MFEKMESRATIQYRIMTKSDLHIGGHGSTAPAEVDSPVIKTTDGIPFVPGSSLKGVLRTEWERLLRGCCIDACMVPDVCGSRKRKDVSPCPVCLLFGGMGIASSVKIHDAIATSPKTMIRDGVGIDRMTRKAKDGTKYDIEVVPKGTIFEGKITVENLDIAKYPHAKLGGFLSLVDFFNMTSGRLGHATSRGFGSVELQIDSVSLILPSDYLNGNYRGTEVKANTSEYNKMNLEAQQSWRSYLGSVPKLPGAKS